MQRDSSFYGDHDERRDILVLLVYVQLNKYTTAM